MQPEAVNIAAAIIIFAYMNACVILGGWLLSRSICGRAAHANAAWLLISYSAMVFINTALGAASMLWPRYVVLSASAFLTFAILIYLRNGEKYTDSPTPSDDDNESQHIFSTVFLSIAGIVAFIVFIWGIVAPPPPWDAFVYHLPFPATWLQQGAISTITVPFGDQAGTYFPSNTELYFAWLMMPFHSEFLTSSAQFPFYLAVGCLVYLISREMGIGRDAAIAAAALTMLLPGPMRQAAAAEVDVVFAALFLLAIYFLLIYSREPVASAAALAGLSLGLMAGTKYIGLSFALFPAWYALWIMTRRGRLHHLSVFLLLSIIGGGFWYVRNWMLTGNPIFPLSISFLGFDIFPGGYSKQSMMYSVFHAKNAAEWLNALKDAPGTPLGILLAAGMAAGVIVSMVRKTGKNLNSKLMAILPVLLFSLCAIIIPYNKEARFTYAAWALCAVSCAAVLHAAPKPIRAAGIAGCVIVAIFALSRNSFIIQISKMIFDAIFKTASEMNPLVSAMEPGIRWAAATGVTAAVSIGIIAVKKTKHVEAGWLLKTAPVLLTSILFCVALAVVLPAYKEYRLAYRPDFHLGQAWQYLEKRILKQPANIAYTGTDLSFGLFGAELQNRVYTVPVHANGKWQFHDCVADLKRSGGYTVPQTDRIDFCRRGADPSAWIHNLEEKETGIVFISKLHQTDRPHLAHDPEYYPVERIYARSRPDRFTLIYANPQVEAYRFH